MNAAQNFFIDVILVEMSLFFIVYLIYGRTKQKPLVGNYRPGDAGYQTFKNLVSNTKVLFFSIAAVVIATIDLITSSRAVLHSKASHSILVVAPIMATAGMLIVLLVLPVLLAKKR
ncbi:MAG TPA: hypothetical protein VIR03_02625 [Candidatus Saccharimonadales bacterium]